MLAMQYSLTLPADYDMGIIRERVRRNGHALDDRAGLALKAYLIRVRGVDGSQVSQYAPFYLWNSPAAMTQFLIGGGGFQNIVRDFGRPPVSQWTVIACSRRRRRVTTGRLPADRRTPATAPGRRGRFDRRRTCRAGHPRRPPGPAHSSTGFRPEGLAPAALHALAPPGARRRTCRRTLRGAARVRA